MDAFAHGTPETRTPSAVARPRGVRPSGEASSHVRSQRLGGAGGGGPVPPGDGPTERGVELSVQVSSPPGSEYSVLHSV